MPTLSIDNVLCSKCGTCVAVCPARVFVVSSPGTVPDPLLDERCISCGHCVAVCATGAVKHKAYPPGSVSPISKTLLPSEIQVREMLRLRRSVRTFTDQPVDGETIQKLIDAAHLAPSAHNGRALEYIVIQNRDVLQDLAKVIGQRYGQIARQLRSPLVRIVLRPLLGAAITNALPYVEEFERIAEEAQQGLDPFFRNAPCAIICHAPNTGSFVEMDASMALHNANLLAQSMGLGAFHVGYLVGACIRHRAVPSFLNIPRDHTVCGALALGHPTRTFHKWIQRTPPKVRVLK